MIRKRGEIFVEGGSKFVTITTGPKLQGCKLCAFNLCSPRASTPCSRQVCLPDKRDGTENRIFVKLP